MDFTLRSENPDVVWVCGFEPGAEDLVRELRLRHSEAFIVVTGRGSVNSWRAGVVDAGADYCCGWPLPMVELNRILHARTRA